MITETLEQFALAALVGGMLGFAHRAAVRLREVRKARLASAIAVSA